jgi:hypothetical protein
MRTPRQSPSGPTVLPFAQLGLSADAAFVAATPLVVPFDTVVYETEAFGGFETLGGKSVFFLPYGAYLAVLQLTIDTTPTLIAATLEVNANAVGDAASGTSAISSVNLTASAVRFVTEAPIAGHSFPCSVIPAITVTGGGNGNVVSAITKLFVWQLQGF